MSKQIFNPLSGTFDTVLTDAVELAYDNTSSGLTADDVQAAIDEVEGRVDATEIVANAAIPSSEKGAANGVAELDAGGKVPASQLPNSIMDYLGTWAASTNTPALSNGTGSAGDVYIASDAGTVDFGAGNITFAAGDWAVYSGSVWQKSINSNAVANVNGFTGAVSLDTDDISEGVTNLYFTDERAQDAVGNNLLDTASVNLSYNDGSGQISADVLPAGVDHDSLQNFVSNEHIDHSTVSINTNANSGLSGGGNITASRSLLVDPNNAPAATVASTDLILIADVDDSNNLKKVTAQSVADLFAPSSVTNEKENFTLAGGDVTNQYVDFANVARTDSIHVSIFGVVQSEGLDYTINYTGGAGGNTRLTFAGDLASGGSAELVAGDILRVQYEYE